MYRFERFPYSAAIARYDRIRHDPGHPDRRDAALALALICRSVGPVESGGGVVYSWDFWEQSLRRATSAGSPRRKLGAGGYSPRVYRTPTVA